MGKSLKSEIVVSENGKIREVGEGEGIEEERRQVGNVRTSIPNILHGKAFGKQFRSLKFGILILDVVYLLCVIYMKMLFLYFKFL